MNSIKTTSFEYGNDYQNRQVIKYKERLNNHWKYRLEIFSKLMNMVLPSFESTNKSDITVVDIGCSIGTFALEAAKIGYRAFGIDFDAKAIEIAKKLADEENINSKFICGDISQNIDFNEKIDIAVCFDIFEHLHDDEMGAFLQAIKKRLSDKGVIIFHTFPTQYDYIFFNNKFVYLPLVPFSILSNSLFEKVVQLYATLIDFFLTLFKGKTHKELIKTKAHCNPTTKKRLLEIFMRAGYQIKHCEHDQLYDFEKKKQRIFKKQPVSYRNLFGVAYPQKNNKKV